MAERFLIRTEGGPNPGTRVAEGWEWPLPSLLLAEGGRYLKATESALPPQDDGSRVLRGAEYDWHPGDATGPELAGAIAVAIKTGRLEEAVSLLALLAPVDPVEAGIIYDALQFALEASRG